MRITFIHHSSFCVEVKDKVFIFDYFRGNRIPEFAFQGRVPEFGADKHIYVFASHQHRDHFDPEILTWREKYPNIQYIFPKEIKFSDNYLIRKGIDPSVKEQIHYIRPDSGLCLDSVKVEALLSTDSGVAFLVEYAGRTLYHAGDLNWWHWEGEADSFNEYQEKTYKAQIDKLTGRAIDVAFVVLDPRLMASKFLGMDHFLRHTDASHVFPMHMWRDYRAIAAYKSLPENRLFRERIMDIEKENQVFEICNSTCMV